MRVEVAIGVAYATAHEKGVLCGVRYWHSCKGGMDRESLIPVRPAVANGWDVESEYPLTLTQVVHCKACGKRGFFRAGQWVPAK